jgi:Ribbon-helix-helix protein, copG family
VHHVWSPTGPQLVPNWSRAVGGPGRLSAAAGRGSRPSRPAAERSSGPGAWADGAPFWTPTGFSSYDKVVVTEEQIQKWADEAETGYHVEELKRRGRGRPGRGAEPMQVVAVRLTAEELDALDAAAAKNDMSRSEAIRAALAHFAA